MPEWVVVMLVGSIGGLANAYLFGRRLLAAAFLC